MGKCKGQIRQIVCNIPMKQLHHQVTDIDKEYMGKPTTGWKRGVLGKEFPMIIKQNHKGLS